MIIKAKILIYRFLFFFAAIKNHIVTRFFLLFNKNIQSIYFVDIDNTIANTWPSFLQKWPSEASRLTNIKPFEGMKQYLRQIGENEANLIIYITARNIRYERLTKKWLRDHSFPLQNSKLILVENPVQKIQYLKLPGSRFAVTYIDDLTHGHENGKIEKYESVITTIKKIPLTYIGYEEINVINAL